MAAYQKKSKCNLIFIILIKIDFHKGFKYIFELKMKKSKFKEVFTKYKESLYISLDNGSKYL